MMPMHMDSSNLRHMRPQVNPYYQGFGNNPQAQHLCPVPYGNWPASSQCYGSCIPPAYNTYWPCHPPQLTHHPCCVNHSGFHPVHHASHAPPCFSYPPFPVGFQPRYDYEKDGHGNNFCLKCNPKADGDIVIEEQEPETIKGNNGEAVSPVRSTGCPYPIIWIPHESAKNQEQGNGSQEEPPAENMKIQKSEPKFWNDYFPLNESTMKAFTKNQDGEKKQSGETVKFPFDISKLKSLLQGQDGKDVENQQNKEATGQFPYPIIWIPSHGKPEEGKGRVDVEASEGQARSDEGRSLKSVPSNNQANNDRHGGKEGNFEGKVYSDEEERRSVRNIPVRLLEDDLQKPKEPIKRIAKETGENTKREKSSSPPKASKLPPVCLRVDPLPSKKRTGGSKSLSPPRRKEEPLTSEESKLPSTRSSKEVETKTIPVACKQSEENKHLNAVGREKDAVENNTNMQEGANTEVVKPHETKENREKLVKVSFTKEEAARTIQSMYRGYDVRRRESLKKLKQIGKIREKMSDVKKSIQTLQLSTDENIEGKEFIAIGEMVMSLILELDSIQGLHPSIRDFRKSLARELLDMQESIDSLKKKRLAEKEALRKQLETWVDEAGKDGIIAQTKDKAVKSDTCQVEQPKQMSFDPSTENYSVLLPSPEEHPKNVMNEKHEEGSRLSETLVEDLKPVSEADRCAVDVARPTISGKVEEVETKVSEDVDKTTVTDTSLPSENDAQHSSPYGGKIEEAEDPLHPGVQVPPCTCESVDTSLELLPQDGETRAANIQLPEEQHHAGVQESNIDGTYELSEAGTADMEDSKIQSQETHVDYSDYTKGSGQETAEPEEETEQTSEIKVCKYELDEADAVAIDAEPHDQETSVDHSKDISQETAPETEILEYESSEAETTIIDPETESQATETNHSSDQSKDTDQDDYDPKETEVAGEDTSEETKKLREENQRFRKTMEKLVTAGREQLEIISNLTGRVKSLEKKLSQRKKTQVRRHKKTCPTKHTSKPKVDKSIPSASVM